MKHALQVTNIVNNRGIFHLSPFKDLFNHMQLVHQYLIQRDLILRTKIPESCLRENLKSLSRFSFSILT